MELFYVEKADSGSKSVVFRGPEARHIARVLRHRVGDRVWATDGQGAELEVELATVSAERVVGHVRFRRARPREPRCLLTLAQAVLKGNGLSQVVEGATQVGVADIVLLETQRTIGRVSTEKRERLNRIAVEAMKCSTRTVAPEVTGPVSMADLLESVRDYDSAVVAYEGETETGLDGQVTRETRSVLLTVGPEGGFEPGEVDRLRQAGVHSFSMGPRRLKADIAGVVASAMVLQATGDMEPGSSNKPEKGGG